MDQYLRAGAYLWLATLILGFANVAESQGVLRSLPILALSEDQLIIASSSPLPEDDATDAAPLRLATADLHRRGFALRSECERPGTDVGLDDISLGLDWITMTPTGELNIPTGAFSGILHSVSYPNLPPDRSATRGLSGYHFPGSDLPKDFVGRAFLAYATNDLLRPTPGRRIAALELIDSQSGVSFSRPGTVAGSTPTLFFTIRGVDAFQAPAGWWQQQGAPRRPSGAHILQSRWDPAVMRWECPTIFLTAEDIGITSDDDIDALAFDRASGNLVFSTRGDRDAPLLFQHIRFQLSASLAIQRSNTHPRPLAAPIAPQLDLGTGGELDSVCLYDP